MTTALELARKLAASNAEVQHLRRELATTQKALDNALDNLDAERRKNSELKSQIERAGPQGEEIW